jgi:ribosomal protein S18 acetylase RimI-like enzyme
VAASRLARLGRHLLEVVPVDILEWRSGGLVPSRPEIEGAQLHLLTPQSGAGFEALPPRYAKHARSYLKRGDSGYVVTVRGSFAGWLWMSRVSHRDPWSGLRFRIAPDEAYIYAMWAEPEYRELGIGAALMAALLADVQDDPALDRVYGWVDEPNREMQLLVRMMFGFQEVQKVRRARVLHLAGVQVPLTDRPRSGPVSRRGRHSGEA